MEHQTASTLASTPQNLPTTCQAIQECSIPVDVVLQSSDGKLLGAHSKNLEWFAGGFPLSGSTTQSKIVPLPESSVTLDYFLKFTHNHPVPDLSALNIDQLLLLAEAADKYCNSFALAACKLPMQLLADQSNDYALRILRFKAISQDFEGIDRIAVKTFGFPIKHVLKSFGQSHAHEFAMWINFQQTWNDFMNIYKAKLQAHPASTYDRQRDSELYRSQHGSRDGTSHVCFTVTERRVNPLRAVMMTDTPSMVRFNVLVRAVCTIPDSACPTRCDAFDKWCEAVRKTLRTPPTWSQCLSY
ncbi:hypothetical protein PM082_024635 [Marasmius tenuissimus]|nr:hypothetical protein PM082_024635 [Marasmius tenuissimus]